MNNTDSNTGEIVMYELTNVKLLFITKVITRNKLVKTIERIEELLR